MPRLDRPASWPAAARLRMSSKRSSTVESPPGRNPHRLGSRRFNQTELILDVLPFPTQIAKRVRNLFFIFLGFAGIPHVEVDFSGQLDYRFFEPLDL